MRPPHPLIFLLFVLISACGEEAPEYSQGEFKLHQPPTASDEVMLPSRLWDQIEAIDTLSASGKVKSKEDAPSDPGADEELRLKKLMAVDVFLKEITVGVLGRQNHKVQFGPGGGSVDLADYVAADRGSYLLGFQIGSSEEAQHLRVYFLSHSQKRVLDGKEWGSGCGSMGDLTRYFAEVLRGEGIRANVTSQRDVSLLAGTYIFALPREDGLYLAQISIYDSRSLGLHCPVSPAHHIGQD